ncbi:MAG TPA: ABC transporter permease [Ktedonobacteraceae bacterium]|jgi:rhamnose transport system permease protein|nr:ABC transporter permease [Ktedonobacteraceae bacterium]
MKRLKSFLITWEALLVLLLLISIVMGSILSPYFLSSFNFNALTSNIMEIAIMALPMTLIIIAGEIDLSVASVLGLASVVLGFLWQGGHSMWLAIGVALLVGLVAGCLNGLLVTKLALPSLVITIGTLALYRGLAYVVLGDQAVSSFPTSFTNFGFGSIPGTEVPWSGLVFAILALIFVVVLHFSRWGRQLYAMGNNKEAARFSGINVSRVKLMLFILSGVIAALAGVIFTARFSSARPDNALGFELVVVTVVLLGGVNIFGGRGSLLGVVLAIFIVAILQNVLSLVNISGDIQNLAIGLLLILSVLGPNIARRIQVVIARRRLVAGSPQRM